MGRAGNSVSPLTLHGAPRPAYSSESPFTNSHYCFNRKNRFPTGDVTVMLFVALFVVIV